MERRATNPGTWQDQFDFSQAIEVRGAARVLYCAGQTSVDAEGSLLYAGDMLPLGVLRLAEPTWMIEIEATAVA